MEKRSEILDGHRTDEPGKHVCPKARRNRFGKWLFPLTGIVSFIWFLIRVVPKPSRATYPCQRVAAPLAASFVVWIAGLFGTAFAYRRWRVAILRRRRLAGALCAAAALAAGILTVANMPRTAQAAYPAWHEPVGVGRGIHPGRVAWVWNRGSTNWAGFASTDYWFNDAQTDPQIVERMLSQAVRALTGESTDAEAWDALFHYYNQTHDRGDRGYYAGEKIMIKTNMVTCCYSLANVNLTTWSKVSAARNLVDVAPQMVRALLKHLVYTVGVIQSNITVGDTTCYWPNQYLDQIRAEYPNVNYLQYSSGPNRTQATFSTTPLNWSTPDANGKDQDRLPTSYATMDYFINFAGLKGHSAGVTMCGKNNYGSLIRLPNGKLGATQMNYYFLHQSLPNPGWSPGTGHYRCIVDLMGNPLLGGKTLLYLIDGLYSGYYSDGHPYKWLSAPFNNDWPSSLFASQDPVAIDSVGHDFLKAEWPNIVSGGAYTPGALDGGAEDYIHEAALANNPPSGMFYDPDKNGVAMQSLGVHEHWNNATQKAYSRNLGLPSGIELVSMTYDAGSIQRAKLNANEVSVITAGAAITAAFPDYFYIESDDRSFGIRVNMTAHGQTAGTRVNVWGPIRTDANDERYIAATKIVAAGTGTIAPLYLNARALGGAAWNYNSGTGAGQKGIVGAKGLNNIGLLVRLVGDVTEVNAPSMYYILRDVSGITVKVILPTGVSMPTVATKVSVTGASSCENVSGQLQRLLREKGTWQLWVP